MPRRPRQRTREPYWKTSHRCWYVNDANGKPVRLDPDETKAFEIYHGMMAGQQPVTDETSVQELIAKFLDWCKLHRPASYSWYADWLTKWSTWLAARNKHLLVADVKPHHITDWMDTYLDPQRTEGRKRAISDSSAHTVLTGIQRCFNWAVKAGHLKFSPIHHLEKPRRRPRERIISDAEWSTILHKVPDKAFRQLLVFVRLTGCRPQEVKLFEARHFMRTGSPRFVLDVLDSKGKKRRRVLPLPEQAMEIVRPLLLQHPTGPLFRNLRGRPWTTSAINCRFKRMRDKTGELFCLYNLRHTWATRFLEAGGDVTTCATIMGHQDATTLLKNYAHLIHNTGRLSDEMERIVGQQEIGVA